MTQGKQTSLEIEALQRLLLELAGERSLERLLSHIASGLAAQETVALVRLWLVRPGDICEVCPRREECPGEVPCLHLVASAGRPLEEGADWSRLNGDFQRFPIGCRKVGTVAESGRELLVHDVEGDPNWIARPEWAQTEQIHAFAGQPLKYRDEILGVLGVFLRAPLEPPAMHWLRLIADHAAAAIANARAFEEIERLRAELAQENEVLMEEYRAALSGNLVGQSQSLRDTLESVALVAPTEANVLVTGESGTGKELVACAIHEQSRRSERPLIRVNCASIPRELYESEFFGHVRGAFTGAVRDRRGRFEAAHRGTLFLDEVGEIPLESQSKLLRVLQEGQYERVGEERTKTVDVRVIAATNRDLESEIREGRFREDLYYRLNVFPIHVEPLRKRLDDVPVLAAHFLEESARQLGVATPGVSRAELERLASYDWPGNVRELRNVVERAVIVARGGPAHFDLPGSGARPVASHPAQTSPESGYVTEQEMERRVRQNIVAALEAADWRIAGDQGAAERLGVKPTTLASRIKKMGIKRS